MSSSEGRSTANPVTRTPAPTRRTAELVRFHMRHVSLHEAWAADRLEACRSEHSRRSADVNGVDTNARRRWLAAGRRAVLASTAVRGSSPPRGCRPVSISGEEMARQEHGRAVRGELANEVSDLPGPLRIHAVRRLVEDQQASGSQQGNRESEALAHAEAVVAVLLGCRGGEAHSFECPDRCAPIACAGRCEHLLRPCAAGSGVRSTTGSTLVPRRARRRSAAPAPRRPGSAVRGAQHRPRSAR